MRAVSASVIMQQISGNVLLELFWDGGSHPGHDDMPIDHVYYWKFVHNVGISGTQAYC